MYATDDGGTTWRALEFAPQPLVPAIAKPRRAAPGAARAEAADDDEGLSQPHLNAIAGGGNGVLYVAAEAGRLYRSADGGHHWSQLPSPYEGSFFGILPLDGDGAGVRPARAPVPQRRRRPQLAGARQPHRVAPGRRRASPTARS